VGYTGGASAKPTYNSVCRSDGHTEAIKVEFDPEVLTYEDIMRKVLSQAHGGARKAQYMSAVWAADAEQKAAAEKVAKELGKDSDIPILPAAVWHDAEEYHQKYYEKQNASLPRVCRR